MKRKNKRVSQNPKTSVVPIDKEVIEAIESLPEDKQKKIKSLMVVHSSSYSGPIPPPNMLLAFEEVLHGSANRIMTMSENQQNHRHKMESRDLLCQSALQLLGLVFGFCVLLMMLYAAYRLALEGHDTLAGSIVIAMIGAATVFITRKPNAKK